MVKKSKKPPFDTITLDSSGDSKKPFLLSLKDKDKNLIWEEQLPKGFWASGHWKKIIRREAGKEISEQQFKDLGKQAQELIPAPEKRIPRNSACAPLGTRVLLEGANYKQLHPAIDYHEGIAYLGAFLPTAKIVPAGKQSTKVIEELAHCFITSDRKVFPDDEEELRQRGFQCELPFQIAPRWELEDVRRFIEGNEPAPTFAEVFLEIRAEYEKYLEFQNPETYSLDAAYSIATYFFRLFNKFGIRHYLGAREAGKSKAGTIHWLLDFNAQVSSNSSAPALFRGVNNAGSSLILDEGENLGQGTEKAEAISNLLNSGYESTGAASRVVETKNSYRVQNFSTYSPKVVCNIAGFTFSSTASRTIPTVMLRTTNSAIGNALPSLTDALWATIRDKLYRLALLRWKDVVAEAEAPLPEEITARAREIWAPVLTILRLVFKEDPTAIDYPAFLQFVKKSLDERKTELTAAEPEAILLQALEPLLFADWMKLEHITVQFNARSDVQLSRESVGQLLRKLGLSSENGEKRRLGTGREYRLSLERYVDLCRRYSAAVDYDALSEKLKKSSENPTLTDTNRGKLPKEPTLNKGEQTLKPTLNTIKPSLKSSVGSGGCVGSVGGYDFSMHNIGDSSISPNLPAAARSLPEFWGKLQELSSLVDGQRVVPTERLEGLSDQERAWLGHLKQVGDVSMRTPLELVLSEKRGVYETTGETA